METKTFETKTLSLSILFAGLFIILAGSALAEIGKAATQKGMSSDAQISLVLLNQDPHPAKAGDTVEVWLRAQNVGGKDAQKVDIQFEPQFPFSLVDGQSSEETIDVLPNFPDDANFKTFKFTLKIDQDAVEGSHELKFKLTDSAMTDSWIHTTFNIDVSTKEFAQIISVDKSKLTPGNETPFIFTIHNVGNAPLKNLIFSWEDLQGVVLPVKTDNSRFIRFLDVGQSSPQTFTVAANANANPGLYKLNLKLQYDIIANNGSSQKESVDTAVGVLVGGQTDFDVAFSESSQGKTSLSVSNIGANSASSVTISIPKQEGFFLEGSNSAIIGNLNKGDYTLTSFQLMPKPPIQRNEARDLKVHIEFTDTYGERQSVDKETPILLSGGNSTGYGNRGQRGGSTTTTSITSLNPTFLWGAGILVLLLILRYGYRRFQKGRIHQLK